MEPAEISQQAHSEDTSYELNEEEIEVDEVRERNSIVNMDIMSLLNHVLLAKIKKDFKLWDNQSLTKKDFIIIMLHHLPDIQDKLRLVGSLNELFEQIDVNHDENLEWEEFSNHIIEKGMIKKDRTFIDAIKNYYPTEWVDKAKHTNEIEHMFYLPAIRHLLVMESNCSSFKIYDMKNGSFLKEVSGHRGAVIAATHAQSPRRVVTSANDLTINLWDDSTYLLKQRISCPAIPLTLAWSEDCKTLYSSGTDAIIYAWDVVSAREKKSIKMWNPFKPEREDRKEDDLEEIEENEEFDEERKRKRYRRDEDEEHGHKTVVMALLSIKEMSILVSADLHGKIFLWDIPQNTYRRKLKGQEKGIYSLDWHAESACLFSAGLDREAYVWNPYVEKEIFKLTGHNHSLVGVKCVPLTYQVITADISGMFRVWDIRTFTSIQIFNVPTPELNCFDVSFPEKRIITGSKYMYIFKYDEPQDHHLADEGHTICTLYNSLFQNFITVHPKTVKIWSAVTGQLQHVFRDIIKGDICAAAMDSRQRKLYIGDSQGRIRSINVKNGAKIKKFVKHTEEITGLISSEKLLISSSWDKYVKIHDDSKSDNVGVVRYDKIKHAENVNSISLHINEGILASGSDDGAIILTKLASFRQEAIIETSQVEIRTLMFLNPYEYLVTCDADGNIYFWMTQESKLRQHPLLKVENIGMRSETGLPLNSPVKALAYNHANEFFFTGDEHGYLKKYNIKALVDKLSIITLYFKSDEQSHNSTFLTDRIVFSHFSRNDLELFWSVKAHRDGIIHISIVESPFLIISSSFDCNVHIWDENGVKKGTLVLGGDPMWSVNLDIKSKVEEDRENAEKLLREATAQSYEQLIAIKSRGKDPFSDEEEMIEEEEDEIREFEIAKSKHFPRIQKLLKK